MKTNKKRLPYEEAAVEVIKIDTYDVISTSAYSVQGSVDPDAWT